MRSFGVGLAVAALSVSLAGPVAAITYPDRSPDPISVTPTEAPWVVGIWSVNGYNDRDPQSEAGGNFCTGALIGPYTVITAAHCARYMQIGDFVIVQGATARTDRANVLLPRAVHVHSNYDAKNKANDLALVDLYEPASITEFLRLPTLDISRLIMSKTSPTLYGWGNDQSLQPAANLRRAKLREMTALAKRAWPSISVFRQFGAGRKNADGTFTAACTGDSGGPLVGQLRSKPGKYLVGTVSFGASAKCNRKLPTVFTRIAAYGSWIRQVQKQFVAERAFAGLEETRVAFSGSLPTSEGATAYGTRYKLTTATFRTQATQMGQLDLAALEVYAFAQPVNGYDLELRLVPVKPWTADGCSWRDLDGGVTSIVSIQDPGSGLTGRRLGLKLTSGCLSRPLGLVPELVNGQPIGLCSAEITANQDGSHSYWLTRGCLADPANTWLRVELRGSSTGDLEPGPDAWAGPFNLG